jgi:hypothetical protein
MGRILRWLSLTGVIIGLAVATDSMAYALDATPIDTGALGGVRLPPPPPQRTPAWVTP